MEGRKKRRKEEGRKEGRKKRRRTDIKMKCDRRKSVGWSDAKIDTEIDKKTD